MRCLIAAGGDDIEVACGLEDASVVLVHLGATPRVVQVIGQRVGDLPGPVTQLAWLSEQRVACYTPGQRPNKNGTLELHLASGQCVLWEPKHGAGAHTKGYWLRVAPPYSTPEELARHGRLPGTLVSDGVTTGSVPCRWIEALPTGQLLVAEGCHDGEQETLETFWVVDPLGRAQGIKLGAVARGGKAVSAESRVATLADGGVVLYDKAAIVVLHWKSRPTQQARSPTGDGPAC